MAQHSEVQNRKFLGIEGGGTRTIALLANETGQILARLEAGPANLKLLTDTQLVAHFRSLARALPTPDALAVGLAGAWTESDRGRIRRAAALAWPRVPCQATNDLETALAAARDRQNSNSLAQVLIISGTGSACYGKGSDGPPVKVNGWGHVLGDAGSGYDIGLQALRLIAEAYDRNGNWSVLGNRITRSLQLDEPTDLINWAQAATKGEIARLAEAVFAVCNKDKAAADLLANAATTLAEHGALCARKLARSNAQLQFVLTGSILLKQPRFAARVSDKLRRLCPGATVTPLRRESVWGAVALAMQSGNLGSVSRQHIPPPKTQRPKFTVRSTRLSPTEERNKRSAKLDKLPLARAIELMLSEEASVPRRLLTHRVRIERTIRIIVRSFRQGGRLFYAGAGTSGRLGVLDASECPPTFSVSAKMVQGIIAGGQSALWSSLEGAEDDADAGALAIGTRRIGSRDVVIGIAASGTTPFVWGALRAAKRRQAAAILVCFNPYLKIPRSLKPTIVIAPNLGPEVLTGSTRLKAGTATKLLLNMFTTLAMVKLGKVRGNLMIDLDPSNVKLRDRAVRIVRELTGMDAGKACAALERAKWVIKGAVSSLLRGKPVIYSRK